MPMYRSDMNNITDEMFPGPGNGSALGAVSPEQQKRVAWRRKGMGYYNEFVKRSKTMGGLGDIFDASDSIGSSTGGVDLQTLLNQIPQTLIQLYQLGRQADVQDQLIALNVQRAQQGLSPITLQQIGGAALASPQAGVNVGLNDDTKNLLMWGGGLALAAFVLPNLMKKSRRR